MMKQMMNVPENLAPVVPVLQEDGTALWEDATRNGLPVFLVLTDEDEILPYMIDGTGVGMTDMNVTFRPGVHCPGCGQKMWIAPHKDLSEPVAYHCPCGKVRRIEIG